MSDIKITDPLGVDREYTTTKVGFNSVSGTEKIIFQEGGGNQPKLNSPSILVKDTVLTIQDGDNGNFTRGYKIYANNNQIGETSESSFALTDKELIPTTAAISARAYGTNFKDSDASNNVNYRQRMTVSFYDQKNEMTNSPSPTPYGNTLDQSANSGGIWTAKQGYDLETWCTDSNLTAPISGSAQIISDMTVYAKWKAINQWTYLGEYEYRDGYYNPTVYEHYISDVAISPNNLWMVMSFSSSYSDHCGYVIKSLTGDTYTLLKNLTYSGGSYIQYSNKIKFLNDNSFYVSYCANSDDMIAKFNIDASGNATLERRLSNYVLVGVSPDGTKLAVTYNANYGSEKRYTFKIISSADFTVIKKFSSNPWGDTSVRVEWTSDERYLYAYASNVFYILNVEADYLQVLKQSFYDSNHKIISDKYIMSQRWLYKITDTGFSSIKTIERSPVFISSAKNANYMIFTYNSEPYFEFRQRTPDLDLMITPEALPSWSSMKYPYAYVSDDGQYAVLYYGRRIKESGLKFYLYKKNI